MTRDQKKQKLIQLLQRRAWNPVLRASPGQYSEADQKRLDRVKRKTEAQIERYRGYETAGKVRQELLDDLRSEPAKRTQRDLERLGLPTQAQAADALFALADELGVSAERGPTRPHEPHPPHPWHESDPRQREAAKRELERRARAGEAASIETLRTAPRKWARDLADELIRERAKRERAAKARKATKKATKKVSRAKKAA